MILSCRCVAAYTSDLIFLNVSLYPHRAKGVKTTSISLDHSACLDGSS
ncbi:putative palmitoyl-CoA hydrolase [Helianthus anomalus]